MREATPRLLETVARELGWDAAALWEVEGRDGRLARVQAWQAPGSPLTPLGDGPGFDGGVGLPGRVLASGEPAWVADVQGGSGVRPTRRRRGGRHPCRGRLPDHGHARRARCDRAVLPAAAAARPLADAGDDERRPVHRPAHGAPPRGGGGAPRRGGARSRARVRHRLRDHDEPRGTRGGVQPRGRADVRLPALGCRGQARTRADRARRPARGPPARARALPRHRRGTAGRDTRRGDGDEGRRHRVPGRDLDHAHRPRRPAHVRRLPAGRHRAEGRRGDRPQAGGDRRALQRRHRRRRPARDDRRLEPWRRRGSTGGRPARSSAGTSPSRPLRTARARPTSWLARSPTEIPWWATAPCGCARTAASSTCH